MPSRHFINRAGFAPVVCGTPGSTLNAKFWKTMWMMWLRQKPFDAERFCPKQTAREEQGPVKTGRD